MGQTRLIVLDVLKPHSPSILELAERLTTLPGVGGVDITIFEMDRKVENAKITLQGEDLQYEEILRVIMDAGGTVHSVDKVQAGRLIVAEAKTPQDTGAQMR
ncbi:DUF211 domain-containing protein [Candidatus Woesearchaeota archaeon]|nr:DUF211 domain-containing protein [Candidatus Woesearchaeota archaeon]